MSHEGEKAAVASEQGSAALAAAVAQAGIVEAAADQTEKAAALARELATAHENLKELREKLDRSELRRGIESELHRHGAVDLEVGRTLIEQLIAGGGVKKSADGAMKLGEAVSGLRKRKPFLFRASAAGGAEVSVRMESAAGAPMLATLDPGLESLAREARESGDRRLLLRYLRARRAAFAE